ncbi:MAG TPA: ATP phosphoribosyltransferase [Candidatus Nitrosocosmicus sp.]|jgi:ATP phosphoribosyltransferase|nr:ATP phosphoribosyltransferase [Candidatus Nitrosocosmicus sp.]
MGIIKFVVPKGSIEEATFQVIENAWQCKVSGRGRIYRVKISDPEIEVKILRPQEIPTYVQEGFHDVGITGKDWIKETNADVKVLLDLEYGKVKQVIAIPEFFKFNSLDELINDFALNKKTLRFSTEYLKSASQYIKSKENYKKHFGDLEPTIVTPWSRTGDNKLVEIFLSFGATEAKPPEDVDAVFDITETGTTLIQNNLKIIDQVMESTAVLIANKEALKDPVKREKIMDMIVLLKGVVEARKKLHIFVNVEKDNLKALLNILPSLKGPTVSNLSTEGWFGVNTIIDKNEFIRLVPTIRKIAQGLVILEPSQILSMDKVILDDKDEVKID